MFDPDATKIRFTWPGFCNEDMQDGGKSKGDKSKSKEDNGDGEGEAGDCGCGHVPPCRNCCAGLQACCLNCASALGSCPRCTCFQVRCCCGRLGSCCGGCLAGGSKILGRVFSVVVTLAGCLGMALVVYYLWPVFSDGGDDAPKMK